MFRQARSLSQEPHLIVSIARDVNVARIKGAHPRKSEVERAAVVHECPLADEVVLSDEHGYIAHIRQVAPDIIALGYDQRGEYVEKLEADLREAGVSASITRLESYMPEVYKTSKLAQD